MKQVAILFLMTTTACQETDISSGESPEIASDICGASEFQGLIGQDPSVLETYTFDDLYRIFSWDSAVTMDHRPERLNILIGKTGTIENVYCG